MLSLFLALAGGLTAPPRSSTDALPATLPLQEAPPAEDKAPEWTGSVTLGGKYTFGNSEARSATATADAALRRENDRFSLGFLWLYEENKNNPLNEWDLTDRRTQGFGQYDYFFSKKTYGYGKAALQNDLQSDVKLRQTYTLGVGHQFREDETLKLNGEAGISYVDEDFRNSEDSDYVAARAAYNVDWQISKSWGFGQKTEVYPSLEDSDDIYVSADTRLKAAFGESMFGQLQWLYAWDSSPAEGKERTDQQFLLSIGWKF